MKPYLLGLYEKSMPGTLPLREKLAEARAAGYDYLELSVDESDEKLSRLDWDAATIRELNIAQAVNGTPILSMCLSGHRRFPLGHPDPTIQQKSLAIMQKAVDLSVRLGIRIIQIAGYDVYYEESTEATREAFAYNLETAAQMAAREGVMLAFETMETEFLNTVEKAMHWVNRVNLPYLQVYPDVGNITNACLTAGANPETDLEIGAGHLVALHLKETKPGIYREVPYGVGHVEFERLIKKAWALGVRMYVGEFWYMGETHWRETLRENSRFLHRMIDTVYKVGPRLGS